MNPVRVLVNGEAVHTVSATDRGLLYGDGLFETIACTEGKPRLWDAHMQRLQSGCDHLGLEAVNPDILLKECLGLLGDVQRGVLKIIITRGAGGRGYAAPQGASPTRIIQLHGWPEYSDSCRDGINTIICDTRLGLNPALAGIKHLNRLEQVMARREWSDASVVEGFMLDSDGYVIEGTMSNVFLSQQAGLLTPDLTRCGVAGIMRSHIMALAVREKMNIEVGTVTVDALMQADEVFVCNSLIGIWPVCRIGETAFAKGPMTAHLQACLVDGSSA